MVIIVNVRWRDNNRNPQIFGGTALKKWDCPSEIGTVGNYADWPQSSLQVLSFGITVIKETVGLDGLVVGTAGKGLGAEEW